MYLSDNIEETPKTLLKIMQKITEFKRIRHKKRLRTKETGGKSSKSAIKAAIKRGIEKEF